jgi:hypothetical protein
LEVEYVMELEDLFVDPRLDEVRRRAGPVIAAHAVNLVET